MTPTKQPFILDAIYEVLKKVKSGADFPQYVQDLKAIGVTHYDNYVADGRTLYYGANGFVIAAKAYYPLMTINAESSVSKLKHTLSIHQQGQTDYPTFCSDAAAAGVEKWTTHMLEMTVTYVGTKGNVLTVEPKPLP